jgi:hypothetical protein
MRKYICVIIAALLNFSLALHAENIRELIGDISPPDITICKDEPVTLTFIATNLTTYTLKMHTDPRCFAFQVIPRDSDDDGWFFGISEDGFGPSPNTLAPGETIEVTLPFPFFMTGISGTSADGTQNRELGPGEYAVYWSFDNTSPRQPALHGSFRVKVLPRDENRLKEKYRELARTIENYRSRLNLEQYNGSLTPRMLLYRIRDPIAVPVVAHLLESDSYGVRINAINALREIATPDCITILENYARTEKLTPFDRYYVTSSIEGIRAKLERSHK